MPRLDLHEFLATLPRAAEPSQPLPHDGCLLSALTELRALGYEPIDIRFLDGPEAVRLSLMGKRMGTVGAVDIDALRLEAQLHGLLTPGARRTEEPKLLREPDVLERLAKMGSKEPIVRVVPGTERQPDVGLGEVVLQKRKRGQRGPDKKPRNLGGAAKRAHVARTELADAVAGAMTPQE